MHEQLRSKLCDLYENDAIFDKFQCAFSNDAKWLMTVCDPPIRQSESGRKTVRVSIRQSESGRKKVRVSIRQSESGRDLYEDDAKWLMAVRTSPPYKTVRIWS